MSVQQMSRRRGALVTAVAALISLACFGGLALASFIFTCGMKYFDGPGGSGPEGVAMMGLMMISVWQPMIIFGVLRHKTDPFGWLAIGRLAYLYVAGIVVFLLLAVWAGWGLNQVEWGSSLMQLHPVALATAAVAGVIVALGSVHFWISGANER